MAMDETPVWSDMVYATVVDATGKKQSLWSSQAKKIPTFWSAKQLKLIGQNWN